MNALDLIAKHRSLPMTHVVLTTYDNGSVKHHEARGRAQAETEAHIQSAKIGRDLISRNADMTAGPVVRIISVEIVAL